MTSEERLCEALKLNGSPGEYSTSFLMTRAAEYIEKLTEQRDKEFSLVCDLEVERDTLLDERNVAVARCAEARTIARRLWREKQAMTCYVCGGSGKVNVSMHPSGVVWAACQACRGTRRVTR